MSTRPEDLEVELRDVVVALKDVAGREWYDLGLQLKLPPFILDTIAAHHHIDNHKRMMLRKWLQRDPEASWERLAAALTLIGHKTAAANIRSQFVKVANQAVSEAEQDEIRVALTASNLRKIKSKFSTLSYEVQLALQSCQVSVTEVYSFLVRCFSRDDWIQNPSNFDQLFNALSVAKLWNYDNHGPLEDITKKFLSGDAAIDKHISEYKSDLTGFYATTKIADFIKVHQSEFENTEQDPQQSLPVDTYTLKDYRQLKVTLNLGRKVSAMTLSYVDELWRSLAVEFDLPCLTAVIHRIVEGSLEVTWLVLPHIAEKIVTSSTSSEAIKFFRHHGIVLAEVDDHPIYDEEQMVQYEGQLFEICRGNTCASNIGDLVACGVDLNIFNDAGHMPLFLASDRGLTDVVKALLHYGANSNQLTTSGHSPLYYACGRDHKETVKLLLEYGAQVNIANDNSIGDVPLTIACANGKADVAMLLIDNGAVINFQNKHGTAPLHLACEKNHPHIVKLLLERGAEVDMLNMNGRTSLYFTCKRDNTETVKILLEYGAQVNQATNDSISNVPLTNACAHGNTDIATLLIDNEAVINFQNKHGTAPLHAACANNHPHIVKLLLERGAEVDMLTTEGQTVLYGACAVGSTEIVKILLEYGAQVNEANNDSFGDVPLTIACAHGNADIATLLIDNGAVVNFQNKHGTAPLHVACINNHPHIVKLLLERGAEVDMLNMNGHTSLYFTCKRDNTETVKILLEYGAQVNQATNDSYGDVPLTNACAHGNADIATLLIDNEAVINFQNKRGLAPLHYACEKNHPHIVKLLLERGAEVNMLDTEGYTVLYRACAVDSTETVEILLEYGAEVNEANNNLIGDVPLTVACANGNAAVAMLLIDNRAVVNFQNKHGTAPLHLACEKNHPHIVKLLLERGAEVDMLNADGLSNTPLISACAYGYSEVARVLLDHGAKLDHQNKDGWTAVFYAAEHGYSDIVKLLMEHGEDLKLTDKSGMTAYDVASINSHPAVCHLMEVYGYQTHQSGSSRMKRVVRLQRTRHRRDEVTSLHTFRAILEHGSSQTNSEDMRLKHQTSHMSEESEDNV